MSCWAALALHLAGRLDWLLKLKAIPKLGDASLQSFLSGGKGYPPKGGPKGGASSQCETVTSEEGIKQLDLPEFPELPDAKFMLPPALLPRILPTLPQLLPSHLSPRLVSRADSSLRWGGEGGGEGRSYGAAGGSVGVGAARGTLSGGSRAFVEGSIGGGALGVGMLLGVTLGLRCYSRRALRCTLEQRGPRGGTAGRVGMRGETNQGGVHLDPRGGVYQGGVGAAPRVRDWA